MAELGQGEGKLNCDGGFANAALAGEHEDDVTDVLETHYSAVRIDNMSGIVGRCHHSQRSFVRIFFCSTCRLLTPIASLFSPINLPRWVSPFRRVRVAFRLEDSPWRTPDEHDRPIGEFKTVLRSRAEALYDEIPEKLTQRWE